MRDRRSRRDGPHQAIVLLVCLMLQAGLPLDAQSGYAGMTLSEALLDLRARGLKIVFTSEVVRPDMRVTVEPVATAPQEILQEILEPHGLMARDGPRGTLLVVPRPPPGAPSSLAGFVGFVPTSDPVAGAVVRIVESGAETISGADGTFLIPEHEPGTFTLEVGRAGFVIERVEGVVLVDQQRTEVSVLLTPAPMIEEVLVVTPSRVTLLREEPGSMIGLDREAIQTLPHLADDFFRAVSLLPGIAANDVSARFHVRGGRNDETQILLDGQELYEAYHLKDFDSALSFVASSNLDSADLTTGGFGAEYGDRMAGVLDMTTVTPSGVPQGQVGISVLALRAGGAGGWDDDRGSWLVELRRGTIDLANKLLGNEDPEYGDAYAKIAYRLNARNTLGVNVLYSKDAFDFKEVVDEDSKTIDTGYRTTYFWITHQAFLSDKMFVETALSHVGLDQDRRGVEIEETVEFDIRDERSTDIQSVRQNWNYSASQRQFLKWGFEVRDFETKYDYSGTFEFKDPISGIRPGPEAGSTIFEDKFDETHTSLFAADQMRLIEPLNLELGLRYDRHSLTDESFLSPRVNLAVALDNYSVFRVAWGRYLQSQRPNELQVEDNDTVFYDTEQSESWVVGLERVFPRASRAGGMAMRFEVYRREIDNPRPRYENLYEALNTFPEVEPDRVRIDPEASLAEGVEVFLQGRASQRIGWWANYSFATTVDDIGGVDVPRSFDQRQALNLDLDYRVGKQWHLNLAWRFHTGWPITQLSLEEEVDEDGETVFVPVLGPLNGERLPDYHRLDLRASRNWTLGRGELFFFVDIQNLYDRNNIAGFDNAIDDEQGVIETEVEYWAGILPSVGIVYTF